VLSAVESFSNSVEQNAGSVPITRSRRVGDASKKPAVRSAVILTLCATRGKVEAAFGHTQTTAIKPLGLAKISQKAAGRP